MNSKVKKTMEINNIGNNAGILWNVLNTNGKMTEAKLKKESGLASADFYTALGWLAREGKINTVVETRCGKDCEYLSLYFLIRHKKKTCVMWRRSSLYICVIT